MAFCAVTQHNIERLTFRVFHLIRVNPTSLKDVKSFTQALVNELISKNASVDKAITMASYVPQIISEFNADKENRKLLKEAGVSLDAISDVEDSFEDYKNLANFLGIKNEVQPIVIVNGQQLAIQQKVKEFSAANKVEIVNDKRSINGVSYDTRVTDVAKAGYKQDNNDAEEEESPALKHGNTVDAIAKDIFDGVNPNFSDYSDKMEKVAFDGLVNRLSKVKSALEEQGYVFVTGVTVFNKALKIAGEIDLVAISPKGEARIMDFKTANQRFNETYLKNKTLNYKTDDIVLEVGMLSKWEQYGSQGYIYGLLLSQQLGLPIESHIGIIGINISYDNSIPAAQSKINKLVEITVHDIAKSEVRPIYKGKTIEEIYKAYKELENKSLGTVEELKPAQPQKTRKKFRLIDPDKPLDRIAKINERAATDEELQKEVNWLLSNPIGKEGLLRISDIVNSGLFGKFTLDGITLFENASKGTIYHEGWHRFSQLFLTKSQKDRLYDSVRKDNIKFRTRDGRSLNTATADLIDVEEFLAEQFAKFGLNPEAYKYPVTNPEPRNFFQKIWDFLMRYFGANPRPIELFQKLYTGRIGMYSPSINNAYWGSLNSIATNSSGQEIVSNERFPVYVGAMNHLIGKEIKSRGKSFTALKQSKAFQRVVLEKVHNSLVLKYEEESTTEDQKDELESILNNWYYFLKSYLTVTEYDTLKDFNLEEDVFTSSNEELITMDELSNVYDEAEDVDEGEDASRPETFGTQPGNEESALSLADDSIQDYFRSIEKIRQIHPDGTIEYELDELGFPTNHKYVDIFYKIKRLLSGAFNRAEMLKLMEDPNNQRLTPELRIIRQDLAGFIDNKTEKNHYRNIQNLQFLQSFFNIMVMPEVSNTQVYFNFGGGNYRTFKRTMVSYRKAARNSSLKILTKWKKEFASTLDKDYLSFADLFNDQKQFVTEALYATEDGKMMLNPFADFQKLYPQTKKGVRDFFLMLGMNFNSKIFEDSAAMDALKMAKLKIITNLNKYGKYKEIEFTRDIVAYLKENKVDISKMSTLKDYVEAVSPDALDELAKAHFILQPISFFEELRVFDTKEVINNRKYSVNEKTDRLRFTFEDLAELEEKFGDKSSSGSYRIEDKTKYPYYIPNMLLIINSLLNKIQHTSDFARNPYLSHIDPTKNNWMKRSYFYSLMFDQNGDRRLDKNQRPIEITTEDISSLRIRTEDATIERHPRSLPTSEKFVMDVVTLLLGGAVEMPRAETSSTMFSVRLSDYGNGRNLPILYKELRGIEGLPENFYSIVKNYFAGEIEKRQWYMKNDPKIMGANKVALAKQFNVFQGILSPETRALVEKHLDKNADQILSIPEVLEGFRKDIDKYFNQRFEPVKKRLDALPEDYKKLLGEAVEAPGLKSMVAVAKTFVLNQFILSQEYYNLYFGDLYHYKNPFKRGKLVTNTGTAFYIDDMNNTWLNDIQNETLNSVYTGKRAGGKDFSHLKTGVLKDIIMKSAYMHENDDENILLTDIVNMRVAAGIMVPGTPAYIEEMSRIKSLLEKYNKIDIADGQGIIGMDFYRNFSIITNIWSESKEREYERQLAIFRNHYGLYFKLDEKGEKVAMEGTELAEAKERDSKLAEQPAFDYFNPLKISYTGPAVKDGPMRPVFDKFSVRPILPEVAIGKRDEHMLLEMVKNDIDYLKFESGSKIYRDTPSEWFKQISDGVYDIEDFSVEPLNTTELQAAYLKHQLSTEGIKDQNILGSQFRKIVFGVKYSPIVRDYPALLAMFTGLEKSFFDNVSHLLEIEQNDLFSLLGIEQQGKEYRVNDMRKFLKLLANESARRGIAINNIDYIKYNEATKLAQYPIDYAFNRQQIQDLLSGLIDERLRRLKVNGSSLIQVSSAGFENKGAFKNSTWEDRQKYGTTGLHYYHIQYDKNGLPKRTSTMGVKIALTKSYLNLLNLPAPNSLGASINMGDTVPYAGKIGTLERLNAAMKDEAWKNKYMEQFILLGYRIPTQNNNFIDHMEIMEFLPSSAGAIIIAPIELIIKSGSDFDIDKMNIIRSSYSRDGLIARKPAESLEEIVRNINSLTYEERDVRKAKKDISDLIKNTGVETSNKMLFVPELEKIQHRIRYTILDLVMKSNVNDSIIDAIMKNMEERKKNILPEKMFAIPENGKSEEEAFTEDDIKTFESELFRAVNDFAEQDAKIEELKEKYTGLKENMKEKSAELKWFEKKRQYKNAINNNMVDILSRTLSQPSYFELLVTPSSTQVFDTFTNELIASKDNMSDEEFENAVKQNPKLFDKTNTPTENSQYDANLNAFDNLLSKMKDLGAYAIQRTFADMFNFIEFSVAKRYSRTLRNGSTQEKTIYTPLISPDERGKVVKHGRILMHGDSVSDGKTSKLYSIKNAFDELISLTVDLANSPAYAYMGINAYNKKHFQFLLHQKVNPKVALWFVNQPILLELYDLFEKEKRKKVGYTLKHAITELSLKKGVLKNSQKENSSKMKYEITSSRWEAYDQMKIEATGERGEMITNSKKANPFLPRPYHDIHTQNLTEDDYISIDEMDKAIRDNDSSSKLQKKVLAYFASITEEADDLMKLQFANNVDTTKYSTLTSIIRNIDNRRSLRLETTLFDNNQLNKLEKESMIAPFDYTHRALAIQKALFPKLYTNQTINTFTDLVTDVWGAKNIQIEKISKIIENDYIEFIYKNFGVYKGQNISDHFTPLLVNLDGTQDHEYFSHRFLNIVKRFPELLRIPFVAGLYEDTYYPSIETRNDSEDKDIMWDMLKGWSDFEIHNLFFFRNPENPTHDKNIYTGNWRNLINFSAEKLGLKKEYTANDAADISEIFHEMIYFSLFQSGQTNTGNGFSDLIPYEHWGHFIQDAFNRLDRASTANNSLFREYLRNFERMFKQNNPKINWQTKNVPTGDYDNNNREIVKQLPMNMNYYRGKDYVVTDDDLNFVRTLVTDEIVDRLVPVEEQLAAKKATIPFELGRHVTYDGNQYIIVKSTGRPKVWQIYNPLKEGSSAKIEVHERSLTADLATANVVQYGLKKYLVTKDGSIYDLEKNKKVTWKKDDKHRKNIMELVKKQSPPAEENGINPDDKPPVPPECPV